MLFTKLNSIWQEHTGGVDELPIFQVERNYLEIHAQILITGISGKCLSTLVMNQFCILIIFTTS